MRAGYHKATKKVPEKKALYYTRAWKRLRVAALQRDNYLCKHCLKKKRLTKATEVHHIKPVEFHPDSALDIDNLVSLCWECHEETKPRGVEIVHQARVIKITGDNNAFP